MSIGATGTIGESTVTQVLERAMRNYLSSKIIRAYPAPRKILAHMPKEIPTDARIFMATLYSCKKAVNNCH